MASPKLNRLGGLFAMVGSLLWLSTLGVPVLRIGNEGVWRSLFLNPAMLLFMMGLIGFHERQARRSGRLGKAGFGISLLGIGTMLLGNIAEFGVNKYLHGTLMPGWRPGWLMMGAGLMILAAGLVLLGIGTFGARVFTAWRRAVPLGFGLMLALMVVVSMAAHVWSGSGPADKALMPIVGFFGGVGFPIGWAALGYALWSEKAEGSGTSAG